MISSRSDIALAVGVVGIICVLVIPIPTVLLDFALAFNITFSLIVLLTTLYITRPLDLSVFPGMLLIVTLMRLSLNVASTRLILGQAYAGEVINSFGNFVVQGNYVVGFIVFIILVIIQFVVITKGAGRISEVADGTIWIDAKTSLRSGDNKVFRIETVCRFLEAAMPWVKHWW